MNMVTDILSSGVDEERFMYFGDVIEVEECNENSTYIVKKGRSNGDDQDGMERKGLIAIQLDAMTKEELMKKGNRVAKVWSVWSVIDVREWLVLSVLWRPVLRGVQSARMHCVMCRHDVCRKCRHEIACECESRLELWSGNENDDGVEQCEVIKTKDQAAPSSGGSSDEYAHGNDSDCDGELSNDVEGENATRREPSGVESNQGTEDVMNASDLELRTEGDRGVPQVGQHRTAINPRTDKNKRKIYYPIGVKRSFFFCNAEVKKAERLVDLIERNAADNGTLAFFEPDGTQCWGIYIDGSRRRSRCDVYRNKSSSDIPRKATLFNLGHGEFNVLLMDWVCATCGYENHCNGDAHGIFPAARGTAYTVELMYWWIGEMYTNTRSFRAVYQSTRKIQKTASHKRRFTNGRLCTLAASHRPNRRTENQALRRFIHAIEVEEAESSSALFSCKTCETEMEESDSAQLGNDRNKYGGTKRLRCVEIDAKVVALLKETRRCNDGHDGLPGVPGLNTRVVRNRSTQNVLRMFFKATRAAIGQIRNALAAGGDAISGDIGGKWYEVRDGYLQIRLGGMGKYGSTVGQRKRKNILACMNVVRWYIDHSVCICAGESRSDERDHGGCAAARLKLFGTEGRMVAAYVMQALFELVNVPVYSSNNSAGTTERALNGSVSELIASHGDGEDYGDQAGDAEDGGNGSDYEDMAEEDAWVRCKFAQYHCIGEQLDTVVELLSFCILEPITLGFFPFHTEARNSASHDVEAYVGEATVPDGTSAIHVPASLSAIPVQTDPGPINHSSSDREVRDMVKRLAGESTELHKEVAERLEQLCSYLHDGRSTSQWACKPCEKLQGMNIRAIMLQNSVLGRYVQEVISNEKYRVQFSEIVVGVVSSVLLSRVAEFDKYLCNLSQKMHPSSIQYWKRYGSVSLPTIGDEKETGGVAVKGKSLYAFPGRSRVSRGIDFDKVDRQDCTKNYFKR